MTLGEKLKQARLAKGLSQRQLCGDTITRNMLSQIENGASHPSMNTLAVLAGRLGKPIGYFLEEEDSSRGDLLYRALTATPEAAVQLLEAPEEPEAALMPIYRQLYAKNCLLLAEKAIREEKPGYARTLLDRAKEAGSGEDFTRTWALLSFRLDPSGAGELAKCLPSLSEELLLLARAALEEDDPRRCLTLLQAAASEEAEHRLLRGQAQLALGEYAQAADTLSRLPETKAVCALLEICYKELKDFEKAYRYACLQR